MTTSSRWPWCVVLVLDLVACGDTTAEGGGDTEPIALAALPTETARAVCPLVFSCPVAGDSRQVRDARFAQWVWGDAGACLERMAVEQALASWLLQAASGVVAYDGERARACLDALTCSDVEQGIDWGTLFEHGGRCDGVFHGDADIGGDCARDEDCTGRAVCRFDGECPGVCALGDQVGEPCEGNVVSCIAADPNVRLRCVEGPPVNGQFGEATCKEVRVQVARLGEPCDGAEGPEDLTVRPCADGLYCDWSEFDPAAPASPVCRTAAALGEACGSEAPDCASLLACVDHVCLAPPTFGGLGAACGTHLADRPGPCRWWDGLSCIDGKCAPLGDGSQGSTCDDDAPTCDAGQFCHYDEGAGQSTCVPRAAVGEPCRGFADCQSGLCWGGRCLDAFECGGA